MAKLAELTDLKKWHENFSEHQLMMDDLMAISGNLPKGEAIGAVIRFPMADSHAYYVVVSVEDNVPVIANIPYMDAWTIPTAHIRGLELDDILNYHNQYQEMQALFKKSA